jgi:hypothetical protein
MELKAEQLALQKEASKGQRVTCPVCNKPAVMYMDKKRGVIDYEHRDEPPTGEYTYGKTGQKYYRYRRCYGGRIGKSLAEIIEEGADQPEQEEQEQTTAATMPSEQQMVDKQLVECGKCHGKKNPGMTTYHVYENGHQVWKHLDKITSYSTYPDGTKRPNYARCVIKHGIRNKGQEAQPKQKQKQEPKRGRGRPRLDYKSLYVKEKAKVQKLRRTLQQMQDMGESALEWS